MTRIADPLIAELEQEASATREALRRVPGDRLDWRPHRKSMTLGQLAMHVATIPAVLTDFAAQPQFELPDSFDQPAAGSADELVPLLDRSIAKAREYMGRLDDSAAMATWRLMKRGQEVLAMPRIGLLRGLMLNHWYHHRGQLSVYLRLLDVPVPATFGPSADENPFASLQG